MAALVASVNEGGGSGTVTLTTSAIDTTGANLIVVGLTNYTSAGTGATISDSKGNTWTALTNRLAAGGVQHKQFYCFNPTVGSGHTFSTTTDYPLLSVVAFSGADASPFDVENGATGSATTLATGSVTPSTANNILVASVGRGGTGGTITIDSSFTEPQADATGGAFQASIAYLIQAAATAQNPTWSGLASGGFDNATSIAVFKATAGTTTKPWYAYAQQ